MMKRNAEEAGLNSVKTIKKKKIIPEAVVAEGEVKKSTPRRKKIEVKKLDPEAKEILEKLTRYFGEKLLAACKKKMVKEGSKELNYDMVAATIASKSELAFLRGNGIFFF